MHAENDNEPKTKVSEARAIGEIVQALDITQKTEADLFTEEYGPTLYPMMVQGTLSSVIERTGQGVERHHITTEKEERLADMLQDIIYDADSIEDARKKGVQALLPEVNGDKAFAEDYFTSHILHALVSHRIDMLSGGRIEGFSGFSEQAGYGADPMMLRMFMLQDNLTSLEQLLQSHGVGKQQALICIKAFDSEMLRSVGAFKGDTVEMG